ncbi:MAG TPA: DUF6708 domain-containing protein, partial [Duganella sp.]|nr:DUF6708 domain-containing protein [Duganella sp.]
AIGVFTPIGIFFFLKFVRLELFRPEEEPIIFDRKNRKVYRIFREVQPGWKGLLKKWPLRSATYDWNLIDAEHHAAVNANTATISRIHSLVLIVRQSATDPTVVDAFTLGNSMLMGEVTVSAVYEHVRMFMEDGGPHLPLGEVLSPSEKPATFLKCMARTGPYGDTLKLWWQHARLLTILGFLLFPIFFPIVTLLGIFAWFSYVTAISIKWSDEVLAAVGPPIVEGEDEPEEKRGK